MVKIAEAIVEHGPLTDEQVCNCYPLMSIDIVRAAVKDLAFKGLIKSTRVKDESHGWFVKKYEIVIK